jgi:hypothetical protein
VAAATVIRDHCLAPGRVDAPIAEGGRYGRMLGEVGGRIVADVLYGVILRDPESYLAIDPDWAPTLPARSAPFGLADILVPVEAPARAAAPAG